MIENTTNLNEGNMTDSPSCYYLDRFHVYQAGLPSIQYIVNCTLNVVLSIAAIFGNAMILYVLPKSSSLRPPTRALVFSLALSDIAVGSIVQPLFVVYRIAELKNNHPAYCIAGTGFHLSANVFSAVSFLTVVAIAVDRLLALHLGIKYQPTVSLRRVIVVILSLWALTSLWVSTWLQGIRLYQMFNIAATSVCLFVCLATYASVWLRIRHMKIRAMSRNNIDRRVEGGNTNDSTFRNYKRSVMSMFYIYILLLVCYTPYLVMFIVIETSKVNSTKIAALSYSITILFANSAFNPFLYCWRIKEIRNDVSTVISNFIST